MCGYGVAKEQLDQFTVPTVSFQLV
jgi:hypothetical protein